ncbi:putative ABC transport system permease protein [Halanaerobium congolense]|jgi:putative ABC transport system permease protein|uniref:ABC transport system permease protein n=1 Tax=Halanaerobium congolense TaxID=54121 RepID=A0A4R8GFE5_9FIRM|nr:iron export ABC transporter permease subunit FetB [Halanaerobium congolense]KXS49521.1 MAG: putative ABC transport system permease protein [Halanaerobium sp. T82-1]PTX15614.1 putative ABC transport system permease protein [Halanaerobium congolense]TDX39154.1 putative ABC transport system permease protein [Halanaerobium congolense]SDE87191.1 putative ABC transport system permease protein [Halanaerobium congolense]SES67798.1 putative ABC transport system permease protein [Halanaerobium congol
MSGTIDIQIMQLVFAYIFVLVLLFIVKQKEIGHKGEILLASVRMTIQLIAVGFILEYVFSNQSPIYSILILLIMETFAIYNIFGRVEGRISKKLKLIIAGSMFLGTSISILFFVIAVVGLDPWFRADYFIPLSGMLIGNSMTGISLGVNYLINGIRDNKNLVENYLMLGAEPETAVKEISNRAFYNAVLPTINSMMGMGIVFLPGMMTGQIIAGASPIIAIKYQIAIMMGILGSVTLTVFFMVNKGAKTFFNSRKQLNL